MTTNLFGERFMGHRAPAWHSLGTVFDEPLTASEAVLRGRMNYAVGLQPITVATVGQVDDYSAIVREPTADDPQARVFGITSNNYKILQNTDIATMLEPLVSHWPVETVGALGYGETFFLSLDAGMDEIGGEAIHKYFLAVDNKTGKKAFRLAFTPVRVVCENTLVTGLRAATVSGVVGHVSGINEMIALRVDAMARLNKAQDETMLVLRQLAATQVLDDNLKDIINAAYPLPSKPQKVSFAEEVLSDPLFTAYLKSADNLIKSRESWEYVTERQKSFRAAATGLLRKFQDEQPMLAMTPWASYNAVVETEDYRKGWEGNAWAEDALFGGRARSKILAFNQALSLLK